MKRLITGLAIMACVTGSAAPLMTEWGENIDRKNIWSQYPRPTMEREHWKNLNGEWNYAITPANAAEPTKWEGKILVPFCVESALSGVERIVGTDSVVWYQRTFDIPKTWRDKNIRLNFDAVDWEAKVWVNGVYAGEHKGGYTRFGFDITKFIKKGKNTVTVRVYDPNDKGYQPRGKQGTTWDRGGVGYTGCTGIWQTVWLEPLPECRVEQLRITPDVDKRHLIVAASTRGADGYTVKVLDGDSIIAHKAVAAGDTAVIEMPADMKLWTPDTPFIYDLEVCATNGGSTTDCVKSYAAMRKFSMARRNDNEHIRLQLNNKQIYQFGPLDQGYWPDGIYTAPCYEAMVSDVDLAKELGFNMIRKHIKVEPELWYEYCDRNGIIVWQDMPSSDWIKFKWDMWDYWHDSENPRTVESAANHRREWKEIIDFLYNHPSIASWICFNEGWGQHDTETIVNWTKTYDPTRLVNGFSGGNYYFCGDILDAHHYPDPMIIIVSRNKANVMGEYGGVGWKVPGHLWFQDFTWAYVVHDNVDDVTDAYLEYLAQLDELSKWLYTGAVYTQTTDVEGEVNGFLTYDRKFTKIDKKRVADANKALISKYSE